MNTPTWKPITGFELLYEISNTGEVRRIAPYKQGHGRNDEFPRLLKPQKNYNGYFRVVLHDPTGGRSVRSIHSLVAEHFIGPRPTAYQVNHLDRDITNNTLVNLEYVTAHGNSKHRHSFADAHKNMPRGTNHHNAKNTPDTVREIRSRFRLGESQEGIGKFFGITAATVAQVVNGKTWKHVT
jgi:hypothetical protein